MVQKLKINVKERFSDGEVDLSMSDLDEVPVKEIAALKKTTSLDLSNNRLASLPPNFTILVNLTKLDLSKNELTELPEDFGSLSKLKYLDLYKNNLERLPLSFGKLGGLKFLDLKDNPLIPAIGKVAGPCVDTKGCQQCARDVVNFYRKLQEEVDNEVEMRKKARQKQLEINQQKKQEEKKKLKKEKQNSKPKKDSEKTNHKKSANVTKRQNKKEQKVKEEVDFFFYYTMCALIFAISMFLYVYNFQYNLLQPFILSSRQFYHNFLDTLPVSCRYYIESFGDTMYYLQKSTRNITLSYIKILRNNEIIQGVVLRVTEVISSLQKRIFGKN